VESEDAEGISLALISAAFHDPDRLYVESLIRFLRHQDPWVRGTASIAAGHVGRNHRAIQSQRVQLIQPVLNDAKTRGNAEDALEDIRQFATKNNDPPPKSEDAKHRTESMWKRNMNREEVAELIERFLEERSLYPQEWNDFVDTPQKDSAIDKYRRACYEVGPLVNRHGDPDPDAVARLKGIIEQLRPSRG